MKSVMVAVAILSLACVCTAQMVEVRQYNSSNVEITGTAQSRPPNTNFDITVNSAALTVKISSSGGTQSAGLITLKGFIPDPLQVLVSTPGAPTDANRATMGRLRPVVSCVVGDALAFGHDGVALKPRPWHRSRSDDFGAPSPTY